jgi:hypothetical protein
LDLLAARFVKNDLGHTVVITEIDKYYTTMVALSKDPSRKGYTLTCIAPSELCTGMSTVFRAKKVGGLHERNPLDTTQVTNKESVLHVPQPVTVPKSRKPSFFEVITFYELRISYCEGL